MRTEEMSSYKVSSISPRFIRKLQGVLTATVTVLAVGAGTPAGAEQEAPFGTVAGTPAQVANLQVVPFEADQFGDLAFLCPPAGCRDASGESIVQLDESVWDDVAVDTGDQFPDEVNAVVRHTFAGHIVGLKRQGIGLQLQDETPASPTADIVCFSVPVGRASERLCAKIVEEPSGGTPNLAPLAVTKDASMLCDRLVSKTVRTIPDIAYVVQLSTVPPPSGPQDGVHILVCDGYNWEDADPADFDEDGVAVAGHQQLDVVKTPGIAKCDGIRCR
jgi:hypothetical protein